MDDGYDLISKAAYKVATDLPLATAQIAARVIAASNSIEQAKSRLGDLPHPHYRALVSWFLETCGNALPNVPTRAISLCLLTAAHAEKLHRDEQSVELVWTGPDSDSVPFRRTEQAILQVLDSARQRITLVSYAVYRIPNICEALVRAARRGVRINVIVETPDRLEGENEYSTLRALGAEVAACAAVFFWPQEQRAQSAHGKYGILHVKCAVADGRWLFLSSANLTEYAFGINMELGVLISGGDLPTRVESQFDRLIALGMLVRI